MKSRIFNIKNTSLLLLVLLLGNTSCNYFSNPLVDRDSGESVKLLIIDFNFVKTKVAFHLKDIISDEYIDIEEIDLFFIGEDEDNLITFTGLKPDKFSTSSGFIEIGVDPNRIPSSESPVAFTVVAISPNYVSAPLALSYSTDGFKDVVIKMIKIGGGMKTGSGGFDEPYDLKFNDVLSSSDLEFKADVRASPTGTAYEYMNLYLSQAAGQLICENLTDPLLYSDYGVYYLYNSSGLVPPANPTKDVNLETYSFVYSSILRTGIAKCNSGLTIAINSSDGSSGSGSFDYTITYSDGTTKTGIVSGTFPISVTIDDIYYPSSNPAVSVSVQGDAQYTISTTVSKNDVCGATANFTATKIDGLKSYKFIITYTCPDLPASIALSIGGEFRKVGSTGNWTRFNFVEGITELQLVPDSQYDFRINIDGEYYDYSLPTNASDLDQFLRDNESDDFYQITSLSVVDGTDMVIITAAVELTGAVCDILN